MVYVIALEAPARANILSGYFIGSEPLKILGWAYDGRTGLHNAASYATEADAIADIERNARNHRVIPDGYIVRPATAREAVIFRLRALFAANRKDWQAEVEMAIGRRWARVRGRA